MRAHDVVALDSAQSHVNEPGEFLIVAIDHEGTMHQRAGLDATVSSTLIAILKDLHTMSEQL